MDVCVTFFICNKGQNLETVPYVYYWPVKKPHVAELHFPPLVDDSALTLLPPNSIPLFSFLYAFRLILVLLFRK